MDDNKINENGIDSNTTSNYSALADELQKNSKASTPEPQKTDEALVYDSQKFAEEFIKSQITPENNMLDAIHHNASKFAIQMANAVYQSWSDKEEDEIKQRKGWTRKILAFLVIQWVIAVVLLVLHGKNCLNISETIFISFFTAIIIQTIAIVIIMAKYLFKERNTKPLDIIVQLVSITGLNNANYKVTGNNESNKNEPNE